MHSKQYTMNDFLMISFFQVFDRKGALSHIRGVLKWGKMVIKQTNWQVAFHVSWGQYMVYLVPVWIQI